MCKLGAFACKNTVLGSKDLQTGMAVLKRKLQTGAPLNEGQ